MKLKNIQKDIHYKLYSTAKWHWDSETIFTREALESVSIILNNLPTINSKEWKPL